MQRPSTNLRGPYHLWRPLQNFQQYGLFLILSIFWVGLISCFILRLLLSDRPSSELHASSSKFLLLNYKPNQLFSIGPMSFFYLKHNFESLCRKSMPQIFIIACNTSFFLLFVIGMCTHTNIELCKHECEKKYHNTHFFLWRPNSSLFLH